MLGRGRAARAASNGDSKLNAARPCRDSTRHKDLIRFVIFVRNLSLQLSSSKINVMNQDDESFLSAYHRRRAGPRPAAAGGVALDANLDLAAAAAGLDAGARPGRRIAARRLGRRDRTRDAADSPREPRGGGLLPTLEGWRRGSRRILPLAGLAASAALLMVAASAAILMQASRLENAGQTVAQVAHGRRISRLQSDRKPAPLDETAARREPPRSFRPRHPIPSSRELAANGLAAAAKRVRPSATGASAEFRGTGPAAMPLRVRPLLDSPNLKRFFWVGGGTRNDSEQVVASIVERTTHFDFSRSRSRRGSSSIRATREKQRCWPSCRPGSGRPIQRPTEGGSARAGGARGARSGHRDPISRN